MAQAAETPRVQYVAAGGAMAAYPVPFTAAATDLALWIDARPLAESEWSFNAGVVETSVGPGVLTIERRTPLNQPATWRNGAPWTGEALTGAFNRLTRQVQDVAASAARGLLLAPEAAGPAPRLAQPQPGGVLFVAPDGLTVTSDPVLGPQLLQARAEAVAAAATARADAIAAAASAVAANGSAGAAFFFRNEALGFAARAEIAADRAEAALVQVETSAQRASWALGLMGLANNMTQLLYVVTPFLGRLFGIWKDFGWVNLGVAVTVDLGWCCPPATGGDCEDWGLVTVAPTAADWGGLATADEADDWGLVTTAAFCSQPAICTEDLGWINAVIDVSSTQPIELPIRVPDPCPVLFAERPPPSDPTPIFTGEC